MTFEPLCIYFQMRLLNVFTIFTRNNSTLSGDAYQYLQKSSLPMMHFQKSLPRLPIPALENTCQRYLAALQPLLSTESFLYTQKLVEDFQNGKGKELQQLLISHDKANKETSYIAEPWFDMYLRDRQPLPVSYNPLLIMKHDERKEYNDPIVRASNLVISSLRFRRSLREECLAPEVFHLNPAKSDTETFRKVVKLVPNSVATYAAYFFKAFPLDMSQYQGLFEATRIPVNSMDEIQRYRNSKHLAVLINGHIFTVDVLDKDGNIEAPANIYARLSHVYKIGKQNTSNEYAVGAFTTDNRDAWASARQHLLKTGNQEALLMVDSALFCLCFDDITLDEEYPIPVIKQFLYENGTNRWYDKSFSLIIGKDGTAGINFEHSWGDGVAVLRYFNDIYKDSKENVFVLPTTKISTCDNIEESVRKVEFKLDEISKNAIFESKARHQKVVDSLDMNFLKYPGINRENCKKYKTSPDAVMQLAFQLAFYKQYKKFVATYESCSTAAFRHGRTETIRPCTSETKKFCDEISKSDARPTVEILRQLLDKCSAKHNTLTKEAAMGQGFDRHLFGLRHIAALNNIQQHELFSDPAYALINHNIISTSTLSSNALAAGGFGPVVNDGFGIAYNIQSAFSGCVVTNYKATRNGPKFVECLQSSFSEIEQALKVTTTKN